MDPLHTDFLDESLSVYEATAGNNKKRLFKTLYTNECVHDCKYCPNSNLQRSKSYCPSELAKTFNDLYTQNKVDGLFLSSGAGKNEDRIMEEMISSVSMIRRDYDFNGYVHLKILPGARRDHVRQAVELADRVSINVEAPSRLMLSEMSSTKDFHTDIIRRKRYIKQEIRKSRSSVDSTTQFMVGALSESDEQVLDSAFHMYRKFNHSRVYFSIFRPRKNSCFHDKKPAPGWRQHRLYQMDFLFRRYPFSKKELAKAFDEDGFLANRDPKTVIANNSSLFPVDPNTASYELLLKVPGIGPRSCERILALRQKEEITGFQQLRKNNINEKAASFLDVKTCPQACLCKWS